MMNVNNTIFNMWNRESTAALIDLYRSHECLWNTFNPHYRNRSMRLSVIQEMATRLCDYRPKTTADDVKNKINGIRTQYLAEKNKMMAFMKTVPKIDYEPTLWCYGQLSFLDPYILRKKHTTGDEIVHAVGSRIDMPIPIIIKDGPDIEYVSLDSLDGDDDEERYLPPTKKIKVQNKDIFEPYLPAMRADVSDGPKKDEKSEKISEGEGENDSLHPNKEDMVKDDWIDVFGKFVTSQMRRITDRVLLMKLQHKIQNAIMDTQLQQIQLDK